MVCARCHFVGLDVGHRLDDLVFGGEGGGEDLGEVAHTAEVIVQRGAVGGGERGHWSISPKQAATHAELRTGANHSTTVIIGVPLSRT